jgi:hypothetical protein
MEGKRHMACHFVYSHLRIKKHWRNDMSADLYDTMTSSSAQEDWVTEILPRLPEAVWEQARNLRAFQRERRIGSPQDLLRGLLYAVVGARSFRDVGIWGVLQEVGDVSASNWRRRLIQADAWLSWMLREQLAASDCLSPWLIREQWKRILLVDGTHLACPGEHGEIWRMHTAVDLVQGRLSQVYVTDRHVPEQLTFFELGAGDIVVGDKATGYAQRITFVHDRQADIVTRISAWTLPLYTTEQRRLDVAAWLKGRHAPTGRICSLHGFIERENDLNPSSTRRKQRCKGHLQELIPVRIIAYRLTPEAQKRAERRAQRRASRTRTKLQKETRYLSGWLIVVTTLSKEQWSDADILRLYRARWHIELVFKRLKQLLQVHTLRCRTPETAHATLTAILLAWALMEEESHELRQQITEAMVDINAEMAEDPAHVSLNPAASWWDDGPSGALSEWTLTSLSVRLFRDQVKGVMTAQRLRDCLPQLTRHIHQGVNQRGSLYRDICQWLVQPPGLQEAGPKSVTG